MQFAKAAIRIACWLCTALETYQLGFTSAVPAGLTRGSLDAKTMPIRVYLLLKFSAAAHPMHMLKHLHHTKYIKLLSMKP